MLLVPYLLVFLLVAAGGLLATWIRVRTMRTRSVVQTLALVVGQNLPLCEGLRSAAKAERKVLRRIFEQMAWRLEAGDSLGTALRSSMLSCPAHIAGAIEGAERGGTLPSVLRSLAADARRAPTAPGALGTPTLYSLVMLLFVPLVLGFVLIIVVPKFREIFADFGAELPYSTQQLIELSNLALSNWAGLGALMLCLILVVLHVIVARRFFVRAPDHQGWFLALADGPAWFVPLVRRATEVRALARELPVLHAAIKAGHDLPEAAREAACVGANYHAQRRLRRWADMLEAGGDPASTARRLGFPDHVLRALGAPTGGNELAAGLEYLATYYRSLAVHWDHVLASAMVPAVVLMWGLCVGYVVVALFLPIQSLIQSLEAGTY